MKEITVKSVLNKHKQRDSWFLTQYSLNPYQGCTFNCLYCYIRGSKYGVTMAVSVKKNVVEVLDKQLALRAKKNEYGFIALASATDPYIPEEKVTGITRRCLEVIAKHKFPLHILTRSPLVLRDVDVLRDINTNAVVPSGLSKKFHYGVIISSSFTSVDETVASRFEPNAPRPSERLAMLAELNQQGFFVGMNCMPLLPKISDNDESLVAIVQTAKKYSVNYILASSITLFGNDKADCKTLVLNMVERYYAEHFARYKATFLKSDYVSSVYQKNLERKIRDLCHNNNVKYGIV